MTNEAIKAGETSEQPLLIGRDQELLKMDAILQQREPVLVVITGDYSAGKTTLLGAIQRRAEAQGWKTAFRDDEGVLCIGSRTSEATFSERVRVLLDLSMEKSFLPKIAAAEPRTGLFLNPPRRKPRPEDLAKQRTDTPSLDSEVYPDTISAPLLLLIDGYQPTANFDRWFQDHFVTEVKLAERPIVVVVAERPEAVTGLFSLADEIIPLGRLDAKAVRQHLASIGQRIAPEMEPEELEQYIKVCQESPLVLASLTRVLSLAEPYGQ